jgi:hypothetical protein
MITQRSTHLGSAWVRRGSPPAFVVVILLGILVASGSSALAAPVAQPVPSDSPAAHVAPIGASASIDDATWALVDRLDAPTYTSDTTAALVEGLARAGVATYADTTSSSPEVPLSAAASPYELLDFQAHALAVGAWAGTTWSGSDLDGVVPLPAHSRGIAPTSVLLAAYVATAATPGGALSRALMAGQNLLAPPKLRFPGVVLLLFASDLATAGGQLSGPSPSASPSAGPGSALDGSRMLALAVGGAGSGVVALPAVSGGGLCSEAANWIHGMIDQLFEALKVAASSDPFLAFFGSIWNYVVDRLHSFVEGVITSVTDTILGTVRSVAATIAAIAEQIASILPFAVKVSASGGTEGIPYVFVLGPDPLPGQFTASVSAGDLPTWPPVLQDCANVAGVTLPDFTSKNVPVTWGQVQPGGNPMLASSGSPSAVTDDKGQAIWAFATSVDPGDPDGQLHYQEDTLLLAAHRPELDQVRDAVTNALLGFVPAVLRPAVGKLLAPLLGKLQANLNKLLDAAGTGHVWIDYHDKVPPTPVPSGACSTSPVAAGTYAGTTDNTGSEIIDQGASGLTVDNATGQGSATIVIAGDGSASGSWDMVVDNVFDETVKVNGVTQLKDHRVSSIDLNDGTFTGTACNLGMAYGTIVVASCIDSIVGDCSGETPDYGASPAPMGLGPPKSVIGGHVTWAWQYRSSGDANIALDLTVSVSPTGS